MVSVLLRVKSVGAHIWINNSVWIYNIVHTCVLSIILQVAHTIKALHLRSKTLLLIDEY